jgi:hypothetical protein
MEVIHLIIYFGIEYYQTHLYEYDRFFSFFIYLELVDRKMLN